MRVGVGVSGALSRAARNFHRDNCLDLAAVVAFYALLSLGPLLYLAVALLGRWLPTDSAAESAVSRVAVFVPPDVLPLLRTAASDVRREQGLVLVAIPGLIWVAMSACTALEYAVNVASGTAPARRFWHSRLKALLVLSTGLALLGLSFVVGALLPSLGRILAALGAYPGWAPRGILTSSPVLWLLTFTCFASFYRLLPRGGVRWSAAAWGALSALLLWEAAKLLFASFLSHSPSYGLLQGTLAGLAAFLLWVYLCVAIILVGAELAGVLNGRPDVGRA